MSLGRAVFGLGEAGLRAKEMNLRRFWQQDSNIPTYVRRKYDGIFFGLAVALIGTSFAGAIVSAKNHIYKIKA
ncbi:hypothetical protein BC830DRAFT_1166705 [Chytriomyces sp. MP71]|nr:hypothetical protein BC830DRAFT_1166705 [Chytriomyces sp. MP71]